MRCKGGKTQARKTPLKLVAFIVCRMLGVGTVLLTTNVSGRNDLFDKFAGLLGELKLPSPPIQNDLSADSPGAPPHRQTDTISLVILLDPPTLQSRYCKELSVGSRVLCSRDDAGGSVTR